MSAENVDVYVLPSTHTDARLAFICKLVGKCHASSLKTLIVSDSGTWLNDLEQALWTKPVNSFIAHERFHAELQSPIPSVLLVTPAELEQVQTIGFSPSVCIDELSTVQNLDFPRVLVVADQDATRLQLGRQKYAHYQKVGIKPSLHKLEQK